MLATVHKLLIHGEEIIDRTIVPIGQLAEEAQEAKNKDFRNFWEFRSRQNKWRCLLILSDPLISELRPRFSKDTKKEMFPEATQLLTEVDDESDGENDIDDEFKMDTSKFFFIYFF